MRIEPTFLEQIRRVFTRNYDGDGGSAVLPSVNGLLDLIPVARRADQHQAIAKLFTILGGLPGAGELAFMLGERLPVTAFGDISLGFRVAPNFGEALKLAANFHHLIVPLVDYAFEENAVEGRLIIRFRCPISSDGEAFVVALVARMIDKEGSYFTGRGGNLRKVELAPGAKKFETLYRKHLALTPETDRTLNSVVLDRAVLDLPNPAADLDTFRSAVAVASARAAQQDLSSALLDRVREQIMSSIHAPPSLENLSEGLQMSPRQLRLALAKRNVNYQAIVRSCRIDYASALFRNPALSVSEIAYRLGYSDPSAFTHAFCRWTGKSPSTFRIEMLSRSASV